MNDGRRPQVPVAVRAGRASAHSPRTINSLLIANRGEVVVRIARTARKLGIATVAVYSDADRDNPHVRACDIAFAIGGVTPAESYLLADKLIDAARRSGADAVHPGYGFLSENASFAAQVGEAGLVFVGPLPSAIEAMGDKARARQRMAAAGIPVVPGYDGDDQSDARLTAGAERVGFPIMIKAAAGGGGRGMRKVDAPDQFAAALRSARSEAEKAFGDGRLILEHAVAEPRHVEIQVFADAHGNVVHLGERDCSVQRRHQKIVEEAPSPALDETLRQAMGEAATAVARAIGYVGAGTVEFLLDRENRFYFMEMNTRLQVEHPVTELVTGLDLVEWQLRVARGEPLPLSQAAIALTGHAVEARLCAEEPGDGFLPRTGEVLSWQPSPTVRCDAALADGLSVSPHYDSMLGKLVAYAATRVEALDRLARALDETTLLGVPSNRAFLARLLRHEAFRAGQDVSTSFIDKHFPDDASRAQIPDETAWTLAAWLSVCAAPEAVRWGSEWAGWTSGAPLAQPWRLTWQAPGSATRAMSDQRKGLLAAGRDGATLSGDARAAVMGRPCRPTERGAALIDGVEIGYSYAWQGERLWLQAQGHDFAFRDERRQSAAKAAIDQGSDGIVRSPMNGRVVNALAVGASVKAGDAVATLEAMKMEHVVAAQRAGILVDVAVKIGDQVTPGQVLARIERRGE